MNINSRFKFRRLKAIELLGKRGDATSVWALIGALGDRKLDVRVRAWQTLVATIHGCKDIELLTTILKGVGDTRVEAEAAKSLGRWRQAEVVEALIEALEKDDADVLRETVEALGRIGDKRAIGPLIKLLDRWQPPGVHDSASLSASMLTTDITRLLYELGGIIIDPKKAYDKFQERWNTFESKLSWQRNSSEALSTEVVLFGYFVKCLPYVQSIEQIDILIDKVFELSTSYWVPEELGGKYSYEQVGYERVWDSGPGIWYDEPVYEDVWVHNPKRIIVLDIMPALDFLNDTEQLKEFLATSD